MRGEDGVVRGESRGEDGSAWTYAYDADDRDSGGGFTMYASRTAEVRPILLAESKAGDDESPERVPDQSGMRMAERVDRVMTPTHGRAGTEGVHVKRQDRVVGGPDGAEGVGYGLLQHAVQSPRAEPQSWSRGPDGKWHPLVRVEAQEVQADPGGVAPGTFELRTAESAARVMASGNGGASTEGVHVQRQDRVVENPDGTGGVHGEIHGVLPGPGVASSTAVAYGVSEGHVDGLARPDAEANAAAQARAAAEAQQAAEAQRAAQAHAEQARSDAEANAAAQARAEEEAQRAAVARAAAEAR